MELAPWGRKLSDIIDDVRPTGISQMVGPEDLSDSISDNTDEYEPPFSERILTGNADVTRVDPRIKDPMEDPAWDASGTDLPTQEQIVTQEMVDEWIVADQHDGATRGPWRPGTEGDEDGTPIDIQPVPPADLPPVELSSADLIEENRFVAGEVEVADPPPDMARELESEGSFTAVSVLLGNLNDDTDGAGRDEPG